jgi:hypothetical protein
MAWYTTGTVTVTASSNTVMGNGTNFIANARVGDAFRGPDGRWYEVTNIPSATAISISPVYQGSTASAQAYSIAPMQGYVKASADALRQITETYGTTLAAIKPWATAATGSIALDNLGFGATGKAIAASANTAAAQTAIDIVKTTSASDTTAGRVWRTNDLVKTSGAVDSTGGRALIVGNHGWASFAPELMDYATPAVGGYQCGMFATYSTTLNRPPSHPTTGMVGIHMRRNTGANEIRLEGIGWDVPEGGRFFYNYRGTGDFQAAEFYHSHNQIALGKTGASARAAIDSSVLPAYAVATVPNASANTNKLIVVTNAASGRKQYLSDGTNWRDPARAILS